MSKIIFVNLPVADLQESMAFYEALGFVNNPHLQIIPFCRDAERSAAPRGETRENPDRLLR